MELLVDNARALVSHHDAGTREVTFNETFRRFCEHWGVRPRACAPYRARTKGKDERAVQYVGRNAIAGRTFRSWEDFNAHLVRWSRESPTCGSTAPPATDRLTASSGRSGPP